MIITAIAGLSLGGIVGGSGDETATTAGPTATVTATEAADAATSKASAAEKTTKPEPESTMGEGTYEIGVDAMPGRYKTRVPEESVCYWERLKDNDDALDSIIANGDVKPGASCVSHREERRVHLLRRLRHLDAALSPAEDHGLRSPGRVAFCVHPNQRRPLTCPVTAA